MSHQMRLRCIALGILVAACACANVAAQIIVSESPPLPPRTLCIEQLWFDLNGKWNGQPANAICVVVRAAGLAGEKIEAEIRIRDADGRPVPVRADAPADFRDADGHFLFTQRADVQYEATKWDPARFAVPTDILDLPTGRKHTLWVSLRLRSGGLQASIAQQIIYPPDSNEPEARGLQLSDPVTESTTDDGPERNVAGMGDDPRQQGGWAVPHLRISATLAQLPETVAGSAARVELHLFHPDGQSVNAKTAGAASQPFTRSATVQLSPQQPQEPVRFELTCDEIQLRAGLDHSLIAELRAENEFTRVACQRTCRVQHFSSSTGAANASPAGAAAGSASDDALLAAAAAGATDRVRVLAAQAGETLPRDSAGRTPLHLAAAAGHVEAARALLDAATPPKSPEPPPDIDVQGDRPANLFSPDYGKPQAGDTPSGGTAADMLTFDAYLARSRVLEATDNRGRTPLHLAAAAGQVEMIRFLCERGAAVESAEESGATPLHLAAVASHADAVAALLTAGAYPRARTKLGCTVLQMATDLRTRGNLEQAIKKMTTGPDVDAVRERAEAFLAALQAGDGGRAGPLMTPELAEQIPQKLETAQFEFLVVSAEVHADTGRVRACLKVADIEAKTNEFIAEIVLLRPDGEWRIAEVRTTPFFPELEKLEEQS
ncbi:MAG: ankyrin repeat domain-containing protein [Phycisphaerae bacterium]|jgi:hypothetical protein